MSENLLGASANIVKRFLTQTKSVEEFASFFTEDARYRFGNNEPLIGRDRIQESSVRFRQGVKGVSHNIKALWEIGDTVVCEMEATYTRDDGKVLTLPCLDVFRMEGDLFRELEIYMDMSPLFA
jgi:hypothetical protein